MPAATNHPVARFGVGPSLGRVPGGYVVQLLLHLRGRDVKHTTRVLEHRFHGVVPRGELAAALQPTGVGVAERPPSGGLLMSIPY